MKDLFLRIHSSQEVPWQAASKAAGAGLGGGKEATAPFA